MMLHATEPCRIGEHASCLTLIDSWQVFVPNLYGRHDPAFGEEPDSLICCFAQDDYTCRSMINYAQAPQMNLYIDHGII